MTLSDAGGPSGEMALKVSPSVMVRRSDVDGIFTPFRRGSGESFADLQVAESVAGWGAVRVTIRSPTRLQEI